MVLIHILFLLHLKCLRKILLTAGGEHSCREISRPAPSLLLLVVQGFWLFLFLQVNNTALNHFLQSGQVCGMSDIKKKPLKLSDHRLELLNVYLQHTDNTHTADLKALRTTLRQENPSTPPPFCQHRWSFSHFLRPPRHTATDPQDKWPQTGVTTVRQDKH